MTSNARRVLATTVFGLLAFAGPWAQAQVATGTLSGWTVLGDVITRSGEITLTNAYTDGDPAGDQPFNLSGVGAALIGEVEGAAGVTPHGLDPSPAESGTEGSLAGQSFAVVAGQTLSFTWSFASRDTLFEDRAFVVIDGVVVTLATRSAPGAATAQNRVFSHMFERPETARLAFGVIDTGDVAGVSALTIGNLQLSAAAVPEPAAPAMLLGGLGVLGFVARRRRAVADRPGAGLRVHAR